MKRLTLVAFIIISLGFSKLSAQIHELGVFVGGSNYIGDVGKTDYFIPNEMAYGVLYKWNIMLSPAAGAVLMTVSTIVVAVNASLLKIK